MTEPLLWCIYAFLATAFCLYFYYKIKALPESTLEIWYKRFSKATQSHDGILPF